MTSDNKFLNPYNFVPVKKPSRTEDASKIAKGHHPRIRHDAWQADALHGRIHCTLKVETPLIIGGSYNPEDQSQSTDERQRTPSVQHSYRRRSADGRHVLAIPSNSLRGVIGSTLEALSGSALRVLDDRKYSVRRKPANALNMIGFLDWDDESRSWNLVPCAVTSLRPRRDGQAIAHGKKYRAIFRKGDGAPARLSEILPAYVDNVEDRFDSGDWAFARLDPIEDRTVEKIDELAHRGNTGGLKVKPGSNDKPDTFLGRRIRGHVLSEQEYLELPEDERQGLQCGALRILGYHDHKDEVQNHTGKRDLPTTKKHEYFIPVPLTSEGAEDYCQPLMVPQEVIDRFKTTALERHKQDPRLPFNLKGLKAADGLQNHQYVYFDACETQIDGEMTWRVSEISVSAIWREPVSQSTYEFFAKISSDSLPWSSQRSGLTPAEALLGCVASDAGDSDFSLPALASRVRFKDALPVCSDKNDNGESILGEEVKLQILAAPKPPSPSLYFKGPDDLQTVKKENLTAKKTKALPRGRKWYLHHKFEQGATPWQSGTGADDKGNKQRICARPIIPGTKFGFTLEFNNLSIAELELLCVALRPSESYRHKLGLGKPLGLGSVDIAIDGISIQERDFSAYSRGSLDYDKLPETIYKSLEELSDERGQDGGESALIDKEVRGILETIGNPENVKLPVCYPRSLEQLQKWKNNSGEQEEELFEWFVNNDSEGRPQALAPVECGKLLKGLHANFEKKKKKKKKKVNRRR